MSLCVPKPKHSPENLVEDEQFLPLLVRSTGDVSVTLEGVDRKALASLTGGELRQASSETVDWISLAGEDISGSGISCCDSLVFTRYLLFLLFLLYTLPCESTW